MTVEEGSCDGIIPTCVGSICGQVLRSDQRSDHPHVCGEHFSRDCAIITTSGSSPRVWGASHGKSIGNQVTRIIPTCVGSMQPNDTSSNYATDHPHVCGEHTITDDIDAVSYGSSPRVWGASIDAGVLAIARRIIPTCVGSIYSQVPARRRRRDHPHVCGEHSSFAAPICTHPGSSPRVWGASEKIGLPASRRRIIPTCVGSMSWMAEPPRS